LRQINRGTGKKKAPRCGASPAAGRARRDQAQFRSAFTRRCVLFATCLPLAIVLPPEAPALALAPEFIAPEAPVLPALIAAALPVAEPWAPAAPLPGVPVVPIGVFCVLRWPAPTAGLDAGRGGVPCAKARLAVAAAMTAAARILVDILRLSNGLDRSCRRSRRPHQDIKKFACARVGAWRTPLSDAR
jgi:hypothetical protein